MTASSSHVLYVDHQGHPAPLSLSYYATASRRLASEVDRHPPSSVTEVDSAYCPQCLTFYDAQSAAANGYCKKATCKICPQCRSIASIAIIDGGCVYKCGLCTWTSRECNLAVPIAKGSDGEYSHLDVEKAADTLLQETNKVLDDRINKTGAHCKTMGKALDDAVRGYVRELTSSALLTSVTKSRGRIRDDLSSWSMERLQESLVEKQNHMRETATSTTGGITLTKMALEEECKLDESLEGKDIASLLLQPVQVRSSLDLLPRSVPLRPRKSRRCKAELADGRPGILVKPKLNPLEGDSSLRTGHGQWWKKDSSAIHVVPRIDVLQQYMDGESLAVLLRVSNPTLGGIRCRLSGSSYSGEVSWSDPQVKVSQLYNLLVDPVTQERINVEVLAGFSNDDMMPSEFTQLEPAEDAFLELGKTSIPSPDQVSGWDAKTATSSFGSINKEQQGKLGLLATAASFAWFELVAKTAVEHTQDYVGIPLSFDIEIGDGSWETSLVKRKEMEASKIDLVSFELVVAIPR